MTKTLSLLTTIYCFCLSIRWLNIFQIKEYRWDRFWVFIKEKSRTPITLIRLFLLFRLRLPAKSLRNFLIFITNCIELAGLTIYLLSKKDPVSSLVFLLLSPILSPLLISLNTLLTQPLAVLRRHRLIKQAKNKLSRHQPFSLRTIGITGSYGKSSTKEFLDQILSTQFRTAKTEGNYNTDVGVAISINKNLKLKTAIFIAEMAAYKKGEIERICNLTRPQFGILTGLGNQHLSLFGSIENLIAAKSELLEALPPDGTAYINANSPNYEKAAQRANCRVIFYSHKNKSNTPPATSLTGSMIKSTRFSVLRRDNRLEAVSRADSDPDLNFETKLLGNHQISNLLPCIGLALDLGIPYPEIKRAVAQIEPLSGKLSLHPGLNNSTILNDSYNSNEQGFIAAIRTAARFPHPHKIIISKGIIEQGGEKESSYQKILNVLDRTDISLYTTDPMFRKLDSTNNSRLFKNESEILNRIKNQMNQETLLIIEGRFSNKIIKQLLANPIT